MTERINTGGPAFPMQDPQAINAFAQAQIQHIEAWNVEERDRAYIAARAQAIGGMTVRDYLAAKAMQAFLSGHIAHNGHESHWPYAQLASEAYEMADAMIAAREGGAR